MYFSVLALTKQLLCIHVKSDQQCISSLFALSYLHIGHHVIGKQRKRRCEITKKYSNTLS